ncbi:dimethylaniline monooxygenase 2 [Colletotrichum truncatum]|uniref:Dimethylaniline monooxygenase 2 n=1 Tax=Colletotrichum truncatum TaxID=5467 RepID=A0ACC3YLD8_COLTU
MASNGSHTLVGNRVGIIGTGMIGLVALKNLKEQGLEVTAIERNEFIGGTWHATPRKGETTALPWTSFNTSKHSGHYTDFPFPKDAPTHPGAKDVEQYLEAYAEHFDLLQHIQFSKKVTKVERDEVTGKWTVFTRSTKSDPNISPEETQAFDRLVIATGMLNVPVDVKIKGIERFEGEAMHSRDFKEPNRYEGKNVLVVGIGATGADTQSFLKRTKARSIYLSHRGQYFLAWPWLDEHPSFMPPRILDGVEHRVPLFSDDLADNLREGTTKAVAGISEIVGPKSVKLADDTVLEDIDAIIVCSGYHYDFSLIKGDGNPTDPDKAPDHYERINAAKYKDPHDSFPRLYRGFISEQYPESLAVLGHFLVMGPPFLIYDLTTMALASLWSGAAPTPTKSEMAQDIDTHYANVVETLGRGPMPHIGIRMFGSATYDWLNETAGTGVTDRLASFGREAWSFWWSDRKFYNLLMDGVSSPPMYRLFDTGRGRKPWPGARESILANNEDVKQMEEKWKKEHAPKTK